MPLDNTTPKTTEDTKPSRRCLKHRMWLKKGNCELCIMEREAKKKEYEKLTGSNKPAIFIKRL